MGDELRVLIDRFHKHFEVYNKRDMPLAAMDADERAAVREAEESALTLCDEIRARIANGGEELERRAAMANATPEDIKIMYIRMAQMLKDLRLVRRSEERCIERSNEPKLLAAESEYRRILTESQALLNDLNLVDWPEFDCRYLGGFQHLPHPVDPVVLSFQWHLRSVWIFAGTLRDSPSDDSTPIIWEWINGIKIESPEVIKSRVTATRAAAVGLFALAAKKRVKQAILVLETTYGDTFFEIDGYDHLGLRAQLNGWQRYFEQLAWIRNYQPPAKETSAPRPTDDPLERIRQLADLKAAGLVTEQEFEEKRVALLKLV